MKKIEFAHLHVHTAFSMLDGACRVDDLIEQTIKDGAHSIAITDHGVMSGAAEFHKAAKAKGVKPVIGCEVYEAPGSRFDRKTQSEDVPDNGDKDAPFDLELSGADDEGGDTRPGRKAGQDGGKSAALHLVLLAENDIGYANLVKLVSLAHLEGFYYKPRIDIELLAANARGLIGMSACLKGRIASEILKGNREEAFRAAGRYSEIFGKDNFFLEIQDHGLPDQKTAIRGIVELSRKTGLPLVASNDVHYLKREHHEAHDVLLCLQTQAKLSDSKRLRYHTPEFYLKPPGEMAALFSETPEALSKTVEIARRCDIELSSRPRYPNFKVPDGKTAREFIREICLRGLKARYGVENPDSPRDEREKKIIKRLNYEMDVIEATGYTGYFLVVWDFVRFARESGIPVGPGRGSGAGSIASYCMGITGLDPLFYNLVFERFLNPDRISPPDFDIDFCQARRGEVIEYVKRRYGVDNVAQIATFNSLGAKMAIRDVGRVLEIPLPDCDRLAKTIPEVPKITFKDAMEQSSEFKTICEKEEFAARIMKYASVLEGLYRNVSIHAAGVVIADRPLIDLLPLQRGKDGDVITQYGKDSVEAVGMLKADFLGLQTLTVMEETGRLIREAGKGDVDLDKIPMDDAETFALLKKGDTVGVFQFESRGMRDLLRRIGPDRIEDLIAIVALFRPGPMNMLDDYVERKTARKKIAYDHPLLEPIVRETYGIMLYQEQVQQAAHVLAGYTMGEGDLLRRAMGKKKAEEMEKQRATFIEGCRKNSGIPAKKAEAIFNHIAEFAGYGFNKSHSAGYAIVAYQTAFLKAHYPIEYMSAVLSNEIRNTDKLPVFMAEAQTMGINILPPCVNKSAARFRPENGAIRFGMAGIKNIGEAAAEAVVAEREKTGPFVGLVDFCLKMDSKLVNRKTLETLVKSGAMDSLENGLRAVMFTAIEFALNRAAALQRDKAMGQAGLFDALNAKRGGESGVPPEPLPEADPWPANEQLAAEKELLGIYLSGHPLSRFEGILSLYGTATTKSAADMDNRSGIRLGGILAKVERKTTKTNKPMAVLQIEDLHGVVEGVLFPDDFQENAALLAEGAPVLVCGEINKRDKDSSGVRIRELYPLEHAPDLFSDHASIHLPEAISDRPRLEALRDIVLKHPGRVPVSICVEFPAGQKVFLSAHESFRVNPCQAFIGEIERLVGEKTVYVAVRENLCLKEHQGRRGYAAG